MSLFSQRGLFGYVLHHFFPSSKETVQSRRVGDSCSPLVHFDRISSLYWELEITLKVYAHNCEAVNTRQDTPTKERSSCNTTTLPVAFVIFGVGPGGQPKSHSLRSDLARLGIERPMPDAVKRVSLRCDLSHPKTAVRAASRQCFGAECVDWLAGYIPTVWRQCPYSVPTSRSVHHRNCAA